MTKRYWARVGPNAPNYPWERWLSRSRLLLRPGRDYTVGTGSMVKLIRQRASGAGLSASIEEGTDARGPFVRVEFKKRAKRRA